MIFQPLYTTLCHFFTFLLGFEALLTTIQQSFREVKTQPVVSIFFVVLPENQA